MSNGHYTDEELVDEFWRRHQTKQRREPSLFCYRAWMLANAEQMFKIMLNGLAKQRELDNHRSALKFVGLL